MNDRPRRLNPRTLALIRQVMNAQTPVGAALPPKPLALIPVPVAPTQPVTTPAVVAPAVVQKAPRVGAKPPPAVPVGATPLLPGLGLGSPPARGRAPRKSPVGGDFARLSEPDAPLTDVIIVDTETTGAGPGARLVELGAIRVRDGKVVESFQTLVDPEERIPRYVTGIHGITDAMVKGQPRAKQVLPAFLAFVGNRPLLAHNAAFDRRILAQELQRCGLARPDIPMFCTLKLSRRVFPQAPNHSLSTLARYLSIPDPPAHRAIADCMTTVGVLVACATRHSLRTLHLVHGSATAL